MEDAEHVFCCFFLFWVGLSEQFWLDGGMDTHM